MTIERSSLNLDKHMQWISCTLASEDELMRREQQGQCIWCKHHVDLEDKRCSNCGGPR